jgi:hypothetical protein
MNMLPLTDDSSEKELVLDIPLHADTDSSAHVAQLVGTLLEDIADVGDDVSHADILQALVITTAVRAGMAEASARHGADLPLTLLDVQAAAASPDALAA